MLARGSVSREEEESAPSGVSIRGEGIEALDELRPLWLALHHHHQASAPGLAPYVDDDESWGIRRASYERWLSLPESFLLVARVEGAPIGYAMVRVDATGDDWADTWALGDRLAELETLVVTPEHRGGGLGTALLDRVERRLEELGVRDILIGIVASNDGARRLYERRGYKATWTVLSNFGGAGNQAPG